MSDFLLELRCEEIPARMQAGARTDLERLFLAQMAAAGVEVGAVTVWSTPRRLALIACDLPEATRALCEEAKGPPEGAPDEAVDGFCRKNGVTRDALELREVKGRNTWFAVVEKPGRAVRDVLAEAIPAIIRAFPWPKSQRWGAVSISTESLRWVRPLSGIVAILGEDLVACEIEGIRSGFATRGHRFHHPGDITIGGPHDYADKLRLVHVIVDHEERQDLIRAHAAEVARSAGLEVIADEGLVVENAGLTEWPVPLLGHFDEAFLDVPPEVIQLTARLNQKYFVCEQNGKLANAFICTANIDAADGGTAIVAGNRKVLAARLSDARFFWEQDLKRPLDEHAKGLERITFHEQLGTVAQRVARITTVVSDWLPEKLKWPKEKARTMQPILAKAAEIAKADLVTEMVGEFPELQGTMGYYYARSEGSEIAEAVRDHYKPAGPRDDLPSSEVGTLLAIADKADVLFGFFAYGMKPTGSKDPYALRRAALGLIRLIVENDLRLPLRDLFNAIDWERLFEAEKGAGYGDPTDDLVDFIIDRLKVQQREAGVRHDLIDAVFALGEEDDLVRLLARVHALQAFIVTPDGANLLAGYKRAANILRKESFESPLPIRGGAGGGRGAPAPRTDHLPHPNPSPEGEGPDFFPAYTPEPAEQALMDALASAGPEAADAVKVEDFAAAMSALARLRAPIDAFFDQVTVNDADPARRTARLALLDRFRSAVHLVADFAKIEG